MGKFEDLKQKPVLRNERNDCFLKCMVIYLFTLILVFFFIGQKQRWYLLALRDPSTQPNLNACDQPEFDAYQWVSYWYPLGQVISFKRDVYRQAMMELGPGLRWSGPMAC